MAYSSSQPYLVLFIEEFGDCLIHSRFQDTKLGLQHHNLLILGQQLLLEFLDGRHRGTGNVTERSKKKRF